MMMMDGTQESGFSVWAHLPRKSTCFFIVSYCFAMAISMAIDDVEVLVVVVDRHQGNCCSGALSK